jgi:hypothetical protein
MVWCAILGDGAAQHNYTTAKYLEVARQSKQNQRMKVMMNW